MIYDDIELKQIMREFCTNFTVMEALTEKLQEKLLPHFENLGAFEMNQADIKKFILLSMPNGEYEDVELANQLPARGRSPDEKKIAEKRVKITAKVNRIYNRLKHLLYGTPLTAPRAENRAEDISMETHTLLMEGLQERINSLEAELATAAMSSLSVSNNPVIGDNNKYQADRHGDGSLTNVRWSAGLPRHNTIDLYETHPDDIRVILPHLEQFKDLTIFDPCTGHGAIANFLRQNGHTVIERDLYTLPESHDFLLEAIPVEAQVIVLNPPFCLKRAFLKKCYESMLPFLFLTTTDSIPTVGISEMIAKFGGEILSIVGGSKFLHDNRWVSIGKCSWIAGNFAYHTPNTTTINYTFVGRNLLEVRTPENRTLFDEEEEPSQPDVGEEEETEENDTTDDDGNSLSPPSAKVDDEFILTCPVCFEVVNDETIELPWSCGHHVCSNCLTHMLGDPCPMCRVHSNIIRRSRFGRPFRQTRVSNTTF